MGAAEKDARLQFFPVAPIICCEPIYPGGKRVDCLSLDLIVPNPNQPRKMFDEVALTELAASIEERGVMEPIVVRPKDDHYEIVAGERRYRASKLAGKTEIPAVIRELSDEDAAAEALLENFQREDLTTIEKAHAIQALLAFMSVERCARSLGCSTSTLRRYVDLVDLPREIQQELSLPPARQQLSGFTEGHGRALRTFNEDLDLQLRLVQKVKSERLSIEQLERLIEAIRKAPERKEAFLRIPLEATEEILKRSGVKLEKRRGFKTRTAAEYLKTIQKTANDLALLLDDEVNRYMSAEELNRLLATCTGLQEELETFSRALRKDLMAENFGFMETYVFCGFCGRRELIGGLKCSVCGNILKRCVDCGHYDATYQQCGLHGFYVYASEAEQPNDDSQSYRCEDYRAKVNVGQAA
jgi:ParB family chromosome partitioning protein